MPRKIREIRIDGQVAYVPLTKGLVAIIDATDAEEIGKWNWSGRFSPRSFYAFRGQRDGEKFRTILMHRQIIGAGSGEEVDHIDANGLNNKRANLRFVTRAQNQWNRRTRLDGSSGFKGVDWDKKTNKWRARIMANGKRVVLGYFEAKEDAANAYAAANPAIHGEFGRVA